MSARDLVENVAMDFWPRLTVIIPAFNEEAYLAGTLDSIRAAAEQLTAWSNAYVETIVVDNNSVDGTADIARASGVTVVFEPVQGISRARNTGARLAAGDVLVFIDADVIVAHDLLHTIHLEMGDPKCIGGGVDVDYRPRRLAVRLYLGAWRVFSRATGMVQGAAQFCRRCIFEQTGGYDESVWMGEDVDFYWKLKGLAKSTGRTVRFVREPRVRPSSRRFDRWPIWKIIVWTNPLVIALFRRWKRAWAGWYSDPVR